MIGTLFKRKARVAAPRTPRIPEGTVVWAIGDIHGRLDLLDPLVEGILADTRASSVDRTVVIFLGDYIDRGPDSCGVLRRLSSLPHDAGVEWRFLAGNHERTMLDFLQDPSVGSRWCDYGGDATLVSYGLRKPDLGHRAESWKRLAADLDHKLTRAERQFLERLELSITLGDYFFTHAGARPGVALEAQRSDDLMWIRESFLASDVEFDKVVIHGHTPTAGVYADHRRVGLDTKAYASGVLTAVRFEDARREIVQATAPDMTDPDGLAARPLMRQFLSHPEKVATG